MKKYNIIIVLCALFFAVSCTNILDEDPRGNMTSTNFFSDEENALANVTDLYNSLGEANVYTRQAMLLQEFCTDIGTRAPHDYWPTIDPVATYSHDATPQRIWWVWRDCYKWISNANLTISCLEKMDPALFKKVSKERLMGEARFIRAFLYFHLTNYFGDLPLITSQIDDFSEVVSLKRTPCSEIREKIVIADLDYASKNLPEFDAYSAIDAGRASRSAAIGLMAKVYLFEKEYQSCADLCKQLYQEGKRGLLSHYPDVFDSQFNNSKESLLAIQALIEKKEYEVQTLCYGDPTEDDRSPYMNGGVILPILPFTSYYVPKEDRWYDIDNDNRWKFNFKLSNEDRYNELVNGMGATYKHLCAGTRYKNDIVRTPYIVKFCDVNNRRPDRAGTSFNFPILRWADVLLMYSESLNELGKTSEAHAFINEVRKRAYTNKDNSINPDWELKGLSQIPLRAAILKERALELCYEGHRRFDLARTGTMVAAIQGVTHLDDIQFLFSEPYYPKDAAANVKPFHRVFGVPTNEITLNPNLLPQNEGY